jgi:hypothetical protein
VKAQDSLSGHALICPLLHRAMETHKRACTRRAEAYVVVLVIRVVVVQVANLHVVCRIVPAPAAFDNEPSNNLFFNKLLPQKFR